MPAALTSIPSTAPKLNEKEKDDDNVKCPFLIFPVTFYVICAGFCFCLFVCLFVTQTKARVIWEWRSTIEKMPSLDFSVGKSL